jgi:hypothetical protein
MCLLKSWKRMFRLGLLSDGCVIETRMLGPTLSAPKTYSHWADRM